MREEMEGMREEVEECRGVREEVQGDEGGSAGG